MGYGSSVPRRELLTEETFTLDYTAQEWSKINQQMYWNTDLTSTSAAPGKGWKARKTSALNQQYYSALVIAHDGVTGADVFPFFKFAKMSVSKRGKMSGQIGAEIPLGYTLSALSDDVWGGVVEFGVAGAGVDSFAVGAGFAAAPVSISSTPATAT
jgi:hypothetical protein